MGNTPKRARYSKEEKTAEYDSDGNPRSKDDLVALTFSYNKDFSAKLKKYRGQPNYLRRNRDEAWTAKSKTKRGSPIISEDIADYPLPADGPASSSAIESKLPVSPR